MLVKAIDLHRSLAQHALPKIRKSKGFTTEPELIIPIIPIIPIMTCLSVCLKIGFWIMVWNYLLQAKMIHLKAQ